MLLRTLQRSAKLAWWLAKCLTVPAPLPIFIPDTGLHYVQRIPTVEEAEWLIYDEINAYQLLCEIQIG